MGFSQDLDDLLMFYRLFVSKKHYLFGIWKNPIEFIISYFLFLILFIKLLLSDGLAQYFTVC